ncbi:MAG: biotin--[acetyl-CoA-carboxylase] ligase [Halodesulfurarchaeum sp.]
MDHTRRRLLGLLARGPIGLAELARELDLPAERVETHLDRLQDRGFELEQGPEGIQVVETPAFGGDAITFDLDAPYRIEFRESVTSTNAVARGYAERGEADVVVVADAQTAGRGRDGRGWVSPSGGIWLSILVRPDLEARRLPLLTLAGAVAVARAVEEVGVDATIKWPNDVLARTDDGEGEGVGEERKLAGVLSEAETTSGGVEWAIIGIGINANVDPADLVPERDRSQASGVEGTRDGPPGDRDVNGLAPTSLRALVGDVDRRAVTQRVLELFFELLLDPTEIVPAWRDVAGTLGRRVRITTADEVFEGVAEGITSEGALRVSTETGTRVVSIGDCAHLRST